MEYTITKAPPWNGQQLIPGELNPFMSLNCVLVHMSHAFFSNVKDKRADQQCIKVYTVMTLGFRTDRSGQTVQTQIRLLLEEQSDQGLHCLLYHCFFSNKYTKVWLFSLNFR